MSALPVFPLTKMIMSRPVVFTPRCWRKNAVETILAGPFVIPHVTDAIKEFITDDLDNEDFVLVEIGGTVGDIEGLPFVEGYDNWAMN